MSTPIRVLILEDQAADAELMLHELRRAGFDPAWHRAEAESDYLALLDPHLDIILADYTLPQFNALRALVLLQERGLDIPFIVITSAVSEEAAVECMRQGASDYILKDRLTRLGQAVLRALEDKKDRVERKRAELALRESEERFRIAAQSVSDVVWQWDIESARLDWYGDIDALLGYEPGQFPRTIEAWERILHPDDHHRVMAALEAHFKDDRPYREEYRVLRKDGSIAHWRGTGTALRDDREKTYQMVGAIADITKQTQAEEQLRRSEAALKKAQHVSHVGSWVWHIPTNRLEWSDEMFRIFGIEKENFTGDLSEVIGRAIHPDDRAAVERANLSVIKDKTPLSLEYRVVRPDGTVRVVWAEAGELILDEAGQPQVLMGIVQDITERKKAEKIRHSIYKISEAAHSTRNLDELFRSIHRTIEELMPAKNFYIALYDHDKGILSFPYFIDEYDEAPAPRKLSKGLTEYVLRTGEPLLASPEGFEELEKKGEVESIGPPSIDWLGIPLKKEDKTIGVLVVQSYTEGTRFGEEDKNILKFVSSQVAMAIQRKLAEDALRQSEERFRSLVQNSSDIITILQADGTISYESASIEHILGYRPEELVGKNVVEFVHPEDVPKVLSILSEGIQRPGFSVVGEFRFRHANGSWVYIESSGKNRLDDPFIQGVVVNSRDITERKRAEEALGQSVSILRATLESTADGILVVDNNGRISGFNQQFAKLWRIPKSVLDLREDEKALAFVFDQLKDPDLFLAKVRELYSQTEAVSYDLLEFKDGRVFERYSQPQKLEGISVGRVWSFRDITERKRAEEALRESEEQYRQLFEMESDAIFLIDNQTGQILEANRTASILYGYSREEFLSMNNTDLSAEPEETQRVTQGTPVIAANVVTIPLRWHRKKDNSVFPVEITGRFFTRQGRPVHIAAIRDITERQQAEEALKRSEERYRTLIENANEAIVVAQDSVLKFANRKTSEMTGYSRQEIVGKPFVELIHPDDRQLVSDNYARRIKGEKAPEVYTFRIVGKSGKDTWVEIHAVWIKWQDRPATLNFLSDITERKRAEEALRKSEHMLKMTLNSLRDAVFILDAQTSKIEECNLIASEIFGYKRSEFLGRTTEFIHVDKPALEDFRKKLYTAVEEKGFLHNFEFHMKRRDGKVFPTEHSVFPLWDEKHALAGWVSVVSDITERKQAEDRIQSLMREIEFILGATKTGLDIIDSKFNLRFVDPAWSKARGDWLGRKCYDYFMGRRRPCPNCAMSQALRTKEMVVTEAVLLKEGQRPVQVISIPFQDEKGEWLLAEVRVDITERKRTEEALLASREELRSLSTRLQSLREEERTTLAREIHDELGQALTALNMDLSWLSNKLPKSQPLLLKKVESMSAVVAATMQTVKRLSSELRPGLLDDLGLVAAMQWQAEEFGKRTWIKMKISFLPEEMTVERDLSTAIFRIFQELLTNIARHAKATRVEMSLKRKAGALELRVKDNGRGIKKIEIANPRSLGLIGVRERALAFGGQVEFVGVPRKGTRVVVRLPERGKRDDKNSSG